MRKSSVFVGTYMLKKWWGLCWGKFVSVKSEGRPKVEFTRPVVSSQESAAGILIPDGRRRASSRHAIHHQLPPCEPPRAAPKPLQYITPTSEAFRPTFSSKKNPWWGGHHDSKNRLVRESSQYRGWIWPDRVVLCQPGKEDFRKKTKKYRRDRQAHREAAPRSWVAICCLVLKHTIISFFLSFPSIFCGFGVVILVHNFLVLHAVTTCAKARHVLSWGCIQPDQAGFLPKKHVELRNLASYALGTFR